MSDLPPDPFSGELDEFLPLLKSARRIYEAAIIAGFTNSEGMHITVSIVTSMIATAMKQKS